MDQYARAKILRRKRIRIRIATLVTLLLMTSSLAQVSAAPALAGATALKTATTSSALSLSLAQELFPSGAGSAVVAENTGQAALQGAVYAAKTGTPLLLSTSGSSTSSVLPTLKSMKASKVVLISSTANWFTSAFKSELTSNSISLSASFVSGGVFGNWAAEAIHPSVATEYVMAKSSNNSSLWIAASYAMTKGVPLVVWEPSTSTTSLETFFDSIGDVPITYFGAEKEAPTAQMNDSQTSYFRPVESTDVQRAFTWVAAQTQLAGINSNRVVVAPKDFSDSLALAGMYARRTGALLAPGGNSASLTSDSRANEYLNLWKNETATVTLVGKNLTTSNLATVSAATNSTRAAAPAFRVTNVAQLSAGYTISVAAVPGATRYAATDIDGVTVASSATPTLTTGGPFGALLLTAENANGPMATLDMRMNEYSDPTLRKSAVVGTTDNGINHLVFLGTIKIPRLITRSVSDIYAEFPTTSSPAPIAITCNQTFSDPGLDSTKDYTYTVSELTNVGARACDATTPVVSPTADALITAEIPLPSTQIPGARSASRTAPSPSAADRVLEQAQASSTDHSGSSTTSPDVSVAMGPGDGWSSVIVRWQAFIPEAGVPFPGYSGDPAKPFLSFGGDNHGTNLPNGSYRFRQDLLFSFGSNHGIFYDEAMGTSHKYKHGLSGGVVEVATATASLSELNWTGSQSYATGGTAQIKASATLPLVSVAPPIDTVVNVTLGTGSSRVWGYHDNMPRHEAFVGVYPGEFFQVYSSPYISYNQLPCLYSFPGAAPGPCSIYFNAAI